MGTSKDILIDEIYQLKEENKRLTKRVKELEGIAFGYSHKLIIANQKMGELFKERDELYDGLQNL
tara:strand:+ start:547 stop:741 length:195 start_codon:yes stop_codon:yes gene_type:complete